MPSLKYGLSLYGMAVKLQARKQDHRLQDATSHEGHSIHSQKAVRLHDLDLI
jgi:hypothetical protein